MIRSGFKSSVWLVLSFAFIWLGPAQAQTPAANQKIEVKVLADLQQNARTTFFVVLSEQANVSSATAIMDWRVRGGLVVDSLKEVATRTQRPILDLLANANAQVTPFWIANTIKVTTTDDRLIQLLAAMPEVAAIKADQVWQIPEPQPGAQEPTIQAIEWNVALIGAPEVWNQLGARGEGIVVANIDTGVQFNHPALVVQYRGNQGGETFDHNYNWYDPSRICGNPSLVPCDNTGHGTHTMGTAVGDDGGGNQIGVAPGARWITAKGCETTSACSFTALLLSGQWMLAPTDLNGQNPRPDLRPHIVNNSWGTPSTNDIFYRTTVQNWRNAGIFPVFSIGNTGPACGSAGVPGAYPESFGVGATDIFDNVAGFSGRGPADGFGGIVKPNISAPGVSVRSSVPTNGYASMSGTSMAAPHVSGVVALLWSAMPELIGNIVETETILQDTAQLRFATQCGPGGPPNSVYGWGIVDAFAAVTGMVQATLAASPSSIAPGGTLTATWDRNTSPTSTDWIGLYQPGAANTAYIDWIYVSCSKSPGSPQTSGSCPFVVPTSLTPGVYELRLLANDGFTLLATSNGVTIAPTTKTFLTASPSTISPGGTLTAAWQGILFPTSTDWIGLYPQGSVDFTAYIDWIYVSCSKTPGNPLPSGSCPFELPLSLAPGTYVLRLFSNNSFSQLSASNTFTVTGSAAPSLIVSPTAISPGGTLAATWNGVTSPTSTDWLGLYLAGTPNTAYIEWIYVSCSKTPSGPLPSGSCPFVVPVSALPATYELRLLANDGFTSLATSNFVQVVLGQALGQVSGRR
jgi:subtilisin family serine protease